MLEDWDAARARRARIYAELAGDGNSLSGYRITDAHPSGDGPVQAMRRALMDAGLAPNEVDYVNAHGTSTVMNDRSECAALRTVMGDHLQSVAVSSTKSSMGHLIAAAGAVEAGVCALAIHHGYAPFNANLQPARSPMRRPPRSGSTAAAADPRCAFNSLGFGGSNSCLAFRHPQEVVS